MRVAVGQVSVQELWVSCPCLDGGPVGKALDRLQWPLSPGHQAMGFYYPHTNKALGKPSRSLSWQMAPPTVGLPVSHWAQLAWGEQP